MKVWTAHLTVRPGLKVGDREALEKRVSFRAAFKAGITPSRIAATVWDFPLERAEGVGIQQAEAFKAGSGFAACCLDE
jgi:hypothetical protein